MRAELITDVPPTEIVALARADARAWAEARAQRPIDITQSGFDSAILCHEDGTVSWYLALHHTITDATSSALVFAATAAAYFGAEPQLDRTTAGRRIWPNAAARSSNGPSRTGRNAPRHPASVGCTDRSARRLPGRSGDHCR